LSNIEALERVAEANNRRDYEALLEECDADIEFHGIFGVMFSGEATVLRGHAGLLEYLRDLDEGFDVRGIRWSEFRDLGDRVVALGHARGRGRESGVDFYSPYACLAEFRNGKIVRYSDYFDHGQALEAAGLRQPAGDS
jgi:ketosteroid isomerase-like protein